MTFRSVRLTRAARRNLQYQRDFDGNVPHFRHLHTTCHLGFHNVRTMRHAITLHSDDTVTSSGHETVVNMKQRMIQFHMYVLALSEVRLPGSGSVDVGDGFLLIYAGSPGDGSLGGVALLLSPSAARSWRQAGSRAKHWDSGRELRISLRCPEGLWHVGSAYGPTEQQDALVKDQFYQDLRAFWHDLPAREPTFLLGDLNSRVGVRGAADAEAPASVLGPHGLGARNGNGRRLLQHASETGLLCS